MLCLFLPGPAVAMQAAEKFLSNGGDVIIRMRGLPFDATVQDIVSYSINNFHSG